MNRKLRFGMVLAGLAWSAWVVVPVVALGQDPAEAVEGEAAAAEVPEGLFESEEAKRSYAIGMFFAQRAQASLEAEGALDAGELVEGVKSVLGQETSKSYDFGAFVGLDLKRNEVAIASEGVAAGMSDFLAGVGTKIDEAQMQAVMQAIRNEMQERAREKREQEMEAWEKKLADEAPGNREEGEKFLAENAGREGVVATASGLQYEVLEDGDGGERPAPEDTVSVKYQGTLLDGTVFDDSAGATRRFKANRVIAGWTEGLQLMSKGAKYRFWIPGDLAYGMTPRQGGKIGAMDTLVFDVELVDITKAPVVATPPVSVKDARPAPARRPITAVTPPVAVEIPPRQPEGEKKEEEKEAEEGGQGGGGAPDR